jgi:drug/metabolite transporter (DMT)-like permease
MNVAYQALLGFLSVSLFVFCDYTIIRWAELVKSDGILTWRLLGVAIAGPLGVVAFGFVGEKMGLGPASGFINTGNVVGGVLVGIMLRGDVLTTYQKIGLVFGLIAIVLINLGKPAEVS